MESYSQETETIIITEEAQGVFPEQWTELYNYLRIILEDDPNRVRDYMPQLILNNENYFIHTPKANYISFKNISPKLKRETLFHPDTGLPLTVHRIKIPQELTSEERDSKYFNYLKYCSYVLHNSKTNTSKHLVQINAISFENDFLEIWEEKLIGDLKTIYEFSKEISLELNCDPTNILNMIKEHQKIDPISNCLYPLEMESIVFKSQNVVKIRRAINEDMHLIDTKCSKGSKPSSWMQPQLDQILKDLKIPKKEKAKSITLIELFKHDKFFEFECQREYNEIKELFGEEVAKEWLKWYIKNMKAAFNLT